MSNNYRLDSLENNKFKPIRDLTPEEFENINGCVETLLSFNKQFLIYIFFKLNFNEFHELSDRISNVSVTKVNIQNIFSKDYFFETNRVVLNLLSSFKFYIDGTESYLKRNFGKNSVEWKSFEKQTNIHFDSSFAYRFLSKLRHYSQHIGFPIHLLPYKVKNHQPEPQNNIGDFKLLVSKELMLKEKDLLGRIVHNDLLYMDKNIDIKPLFYELNLIIQNMEEFVFKLHEDSLKPSIYYLKEIAGDFKTPTNQLVIIHNIIEEKDKIKFETLNIPIEEIQLINKYLN